MMFDPLQICRILNAEQVDYVVIGGLAAVIRGSSLPTEDIDIVPSRDSDNLDRLGRALTRLGAMIRTQDEPVPVRLDGPFLASMPLMLNLITDAGILDITFVPAGAAGDYEGWRRGSTAEEIDDGLLIAVASLDDVIDSKRAANRPKDLGALPYLESLRDELRRQHGDV